MAAPKTSKAPKKAKKSVRQFEKSASVGLKKRPAARDTGDNEETIAAIFARVSELMGSFENSESDEQLKPFDYEGVIRLLDIVLAIDPKNRDALNYKGIMYIGCGDNEKAIGYFDQTLSGNPADKEVLNNKGIALYGIGKDKEALEYVDKAIELDRRYSDALMNKAVILHGMGKDKEAEQLMAKARAFYTVNG
ncbi:MAG TPA: tetratricopeptide repeat protein [Methanocella sp.]|nr:tetratricopeptide repeat protein [Methanocella sp.]